MENKVKENKVKEFSKEEQELLDKLKFLVPKYPSLFGLLVDALMDLDFKASCLQSALDTIDEIHKLVGCEKIEEETTQI